MSDKYTLLKNNIMKQCQLSCNVKGGTDNYKYIN
jgi:hypothetical protein